MFVIWWLSIEALVSLKQIRTKKPTRLTKEMSPKVRLIIFWMLLWTKSLKKIPWLWWKKSVFGKQLREVLALISGRRIWKRNFKKPLLIIYWTKFTKQFLLFLMWRRFRSSSWLQQTFSPLTWERFNITRNARKQVGKLKKTRFFASRKEMCWICLRATFRLA